jgi:hypothetical protein
MGERSHFGLSLYQMACPTLKKCRRNERGKIGIFFITFPKKEIPNWGMRVGRLLGLDVIFYGLSFGTTLILRP